MKIWTLGIATLTLTLSLIAAPQHTARSQTQRLVDQLDLPADQKAKVDPILDDEAKQLRALRSDTSAEGTQKKADLRKATDAKIKAILTPEQGKKLDQLRIEHKKSDKKKQ